MQQAIIFIHGIGQQEKGFSKGSQEKIRKQLRKENKNAGEPIFIEACWSSILKQRQESLVQLTEKGAGKRGLNMKKLRHFMIEFAGDAIAYQNDAVGKETYTAIHQVISDAVNSARKKADQRAPGEPIEFTFVAHSLGTVITSNWLWDHRPGNRHGRPELLATNLFTLGSPIALWLLRYGNPEDATATLQVQRPEGAWINIYDNEDIIGFPLKAINKAYDEAVDYDYNTEVGGLTSVGTPVSHIHYWSDGNVIKPIANKLWRDQQRAAGQQDYDRDAYLTDIKLWNW